MGICVRRQMFARVYEYIGAWLYGFMRGWFYGCASVGEQRYMVTRVYECRDARAYVFMGA